MVKYHVCNVFLLKSIKNIAFCKWDGQIASLKGQVALCPGLGKTDERDVQRALCPCARSEAGLTTVP